MSSGMSFSVSGFSAGLVSHNLLSRESRPVLAPLDASPALLSQRASRRLPAETSALARPRQSPTGFEWAKRGDVTMTRAGLGTTNGMPGPHTEPSEWVLAIWRNAEAVCFDVDCTITQQDSLDLLAEFMGVKDAVAALTSKAMDGTMNLEQALEERLKILNCKPKDIKRFIQAHPPETRLTPGIKELVTALKARGVAVYLISGGFRELTLPIAKYLGISNNYVYANRMNWQYDDDTGEPTTLAGFDYNEPTAHNRGKPQAIAKIRERNPYNNIVMIGDGITDLEAVQETGGADLFIGYGGVVSRTAVAQAADWFVTEWSSLLDTMMRYRVAMVGSGAWACAALHVIAQNTKALDPADEFVDEVKMWVFEEDWEGGKLSEAINKLHENPKYLPGVELGENVTAVTDLIETVQDADIIVICAPHQFVHGICRQLRGKIKSDAIAISLIKGMRVRPEGPQLVSEMVRKYLNIDCSVLMGANIAGDIGKEELSEAVIGCSNMDNGELLQRLFDTPYFHIKVIPDPVGAEMCGTLKNIVAVGSGLVDGLGMGPNTKAAIMRQGLAEMRNFSKALYPTVRDDTFFESCGVADLIATCFGGRNRKVAQEYAARWKAGTPTSFEALEVELLAGQKLQGTLTSKEVAEILIARGWQKDYPLFTCVYLIVNNMLPPSAILSYKEEVMKYLAKDAESSENPSKVVAELEAATVV